MKEINRENQKKIIESCLWDLFSLNTHAKLKATTIDMILTRAKNRGAIHNSRNVPVEDVDRHQAERKL